MGKKKKDRKRERTERSRGREVNSKKKKEIAENEWERRAAYEKRPVSWPQRLRHLTVLSEFGGADEGGDLEGVFADGAVAQVVHALACGGVALLLQLQLSGRQVQVQRRVLHLLSFSLQTQHM